MFGGAEESTGGNFLGRGEGWGGGANFSMVGKTLCMGGKALPLLPHSAGNILLKTGKILSLIAFSKLFLDHVKVSI